MEVKALEEQIIDLVLPIVKPNTEQTPNKKVRKKLFYKIDPLLKYELKTLENKPDDLVLRENVMNALQDQLKGKEQLRNELSSLVDEILNEKPPDTAVIENSDKVLYNNKITVYGNMHIGDIINSHLNKESPDESIVFTLEEAERIKILISKGKLEKAIDLLLHYSRKIDPKLFNETIGLARQWEELQRDIRIGVLSIGEKSKWAGKITFGLLSVTDTLQQRMKKLLHKF